MLDSMEDCSEKDDLMDTVDLVELSRDDLNMLESEDSDSESSL